MKFEEKVYAEMKIRNAKFAVFALIFRDRTELYEEPVKVIYFDSNESLNQWWKTLEMIYEPDERPLTAAVLHLL